VGGDGAMGSLAAAFPASGVTLDAQEKDMTFKLTTLAGLAALVCATPATAQEEPGRGGRDMPRMLDRFDTDDSGAVSLDEFSEGRMGDILASDANGDGELSTDEIMAAMEARRKERMAQMIRRNFDVDGDGKITVAEIRDRQQKRFALLDADNDGSISPDEFRRGREIMRDMTGGGHHGMGGGHRGRHGNR